VKRGAPSSFFPIYVKALEDQGNEKKPVLLIQKVIEKIKQKKREQHNSADRVPHFQQTMQPPLLRKGKLNKSMEFRTKGKEVQTRPVFDIRIDKRKKRTQVPTPKINEPYVDLYSQFKRQLKSKS